MKLLNAAVGRIAKLIKKNSSDDKDMASLTEGYLRSGVFQGSCRLSC